MRSPRIPGRLRATSDDFVVEELPAYEPSGVGPHVFVRFTKRDLGTLEAVQRLCAAVGANAHEAGIAGMKDRRAVTTQTVSLLAPRGDSAELVARLEGLGRSVEGLEVHWARAHGHKLKPGHLAGNRFHLCIRDVPAIRLQEVQAAVRTIALEGLPNAFGPQRFGAHGDNADRALAFLTGKVRPPRDRRLRRLLFSALQADVFNRVLARREAEGTWNVPQAGDLLKRHDTGGLFVCTNVQTDRERARRGELGPTGPMFGARMRTAEGDVGALEEEVLRARVGDLDLERTRALGEGTRRALCLRVAEFSMAAEGDGPMACVSLRFVLPKGAFATTVAAAIFDVNPGEAETPGPAHASCESERQDDGADERDADD